MKDDLEEMLKQYTDQVTCLTPFPELEFIEPELDLDINPDHFIKWLELEGQEVTDDYGYSVSSMCEYSCLYLAMKFYLSDLKGELRIVCGNFGFWEHYWMEYTLNGIVYFIDLTLRQFIPDAPKVAITKATNDKCGYYVHDYVDYSQSVEEYCKEKKAFMHYKHPKLAEK